MMVTVDLVTADTTPPIATREHTVDGFTREFLRELNFGQGVDLTRASVNDKYLAIEESNGTANGFIRDVVGASGGRVLGQVVINGVSWVRSLSEKGETTLAHTTGGVTVVITGSGTLPQQQELAAALRRA